ncbi:MAG: hypothetical protein LQ348_005656 [Seirophora lacunosa]|nr:MAG: hypothetical protein LQ348_005656 [Seirophora lacunosa]
MDETPSGQVTTIQLPMESPHFYISSGRLSRERDERSWREFFTSEQQEDERVQSYSARMVALVDELSDLPEHIKGSMIFYRMKAGLREPIRQALRTYVIQPTSHASLNDMAMAIERDIEQEFSQAERLPTVQSIPQHWRRPDQGFFDRSHPFEQSHPSDLYLTHEELQPPEQSGPHEDAHRDRAQSTSLQILGHSQTERPLDGSLKRGCNDEQAVSHDSTSSLTVESGELQHKLSPLEINRRKSGNLCFYCGEAGHMKGECPQNPQKRQKRWR